MIWCQTAISVERPDSGKRLRTGGGRTRRWGGWMACTYSHGHESQQTAGDSEGPSLLCCSPWCWKELDTTGNWMWCNDLKFMLWNHKYILLNLIHSIIDICWKMMVHYGNSEKSCWKSHFSWILEDKTNWSEWWKGDTLSECKLQKQVRYSGKRTVCISGT